MQNQHLHDGFARAVVSDRDAALLSVLSAKWPDEAAATAMRVIGDVYAGLRSPVYPPVRGRETFAGAVMAAICNNVPLTPRAVLAAPTARRELPFFLQMAAHMERLPVRLEVVHVRWLTAGVPLDDDHFRRASDVIRAAVVDAGWPATALGLIDVRTDGPSAAPQITSPLDFERAWREVADARAERRGDPRLIRDINIEVSEHDPNGLATPEAAAAVSAIAARPG